MTDLQTNYTASVEFILQELYATKRLMRNFHLNDSQENARYDMTLGWDMLSELKKDLRSSNYTNKGNVGAYEGCTTPMKYVKKT